MKTLFTLTFITLGFLCVMAQNVNIPDVNFKTYLIQNQIINTNGDSEIQVSEASVFNGTIDCSGLNINSLAGIEAFTALGNLYCRFNNLTSINLSSNTALVFLACNNNQLTSLNLTNNPLLVDLYCQANQLTTLDLSNNTGLDYLDCHSNQLTSLNLANNQELANLYCQANQLTALNISNNDNLVDLWCGNNPLTSLDVNNLTELLFVNCVNTQVGSLDLQNSNDLVYVNVVNSNLTQLNVKNGNNTSIMVFSATNNPDLNCIQVDNPLYSETNWPSVDPSATFSLDCSSTMGVDNHVDLELVLFPNPVRDILSIQSNVVFTYFKLVNMQGQIVENNVIISNQINFNYIRNGNYILILETAEGDLIAKCIVVKP